MFYSKNTGGFYDVEIHGANMPNDVVEISQEIYQSLLNGHSQGQQIAADENGFPVLIDPVDTSTYADRRRAEYPSIADQLDTLYHGGFDAWKATIQAVKEKYPKEQA